MRGSRRLHAIQARIQRGDLDGAIEEYEKVVEGDPEDWSSVTALGDLCVQKGDVDRGVTHLTRVADHFLAEGFYAKAGALYRRVQKLVEDDHALLSLIDIAARQGLLSEARGHLIVLERQRRARGDLEGADECLGSLDAIVEVQNRVFEAPPAPVSTLPAGPHAMEALPEPEPFEIVDDGAAPESIPADALDPGVETRAAEPEPPVAEHGSDTRSASLPRVRTRGRSPRTRAGATRRTRSLGDVFKQLRAEAEQDEDVTVCHERFDLAQYHLQEGSEEAAIPELEHAARAPILRFVASAQLGRLYLTRGDLTTGIEWLERATQVPPVSPDEGHAVLYELADALERAGETARALVVFMQLAAQRRAYRDVPARVAGLSRRQEQDDET